MQLIGELTEATRRPKVVCGIPAWASQMVDLRHLLRWDSSQYVGHLGVNGCLVYCIIDTGAHRTVIDTKMSSALRLPVTKSHVCGKFSVPGSDAVHEYAGIVKGATIL